jgi:hypothetical protein
MNREEFKAQQRELMPHNPRRWGFAYLAAVAAQITALCVLALSGYKHWSIGWLGSCSLIVLVLSPLLFRRYMRRRFGVRCPNCGKPLLGVDAGIALFSGYCWYCRKKVVS